MGKISDKEFVDILGSDALLGQKDGCYKNVRTESLINLIRDNFKSNVDLFYNGVALKTDIPQSDKGWWFASNKGEYAHFANITTGIDELPIITPIVNNADLSIISLDENGVYSIKTVVDSFDDAYNELTQQNIQQFQDSLTSVQNLFQGYVDSIEATETNFNNKIEEFIDASGNKYNNPTETIAGDIIKRVDINTGENVNYRATTTWYDGSDMTDSKSDGIVFKKINGLFYKRIVSDEIDLKDFGVKANGDDDEINLINSLIILFKNIGVKKINLAGLIQTDTQNSINLVSNIYYDFTGLVIKALPSTNNGYYLINIKNSNKVILEGVEIIGTKNINPVEGVYYKEFQTNKNYVVDEIIYLHHFGLKTVIAGNSGSVRPYYGYGSKNIGDIIVIGTVSFVVINENLGEWGFGINIETSLNFTVKNCKISKCWGDGIYIKNSQYGLVDNVICDNNRRQGLSITSGDTINITNSIFSNTSGTLPESGVDLEPNGNDTVRGITISNCKFELNRSYGFLITTFNETSFVKDISLSNILSVNNLGVGVKIGTGVAFRDTIENVNFSNFTLRNNKRGQLVIGASNGVCFNGGRVSGAGISEVFDSEILVSDSKNTSVKSVSVISINAGIVIRDSIDDLLISNCEIETYKKGIISDSAGVKNNMKITDNSVMAFFDDGIVIQNTSFLNLINNYTKRCGKNAITITNCNNVLLFGNKSKDLNFQNLTEKFAHIKIIGDLKSENIICENNVFDNEINKTTNACGIIANGALLDFVYLKNIKAIGTFTESEIKESPNIKVNDLR